VNSADLVILAVLLVSALLGFVRGFVREILALAGWIAGFVLAVLHGQELGARFATAVPWSPVRTALGSIAVVAACVVAAAVLGAIARRLMAAARLSAADRGLGAGFGLLRGLLIVLLGVALGRTLGLAQHPSWRSSVLLPYAEAAVRSADPLLSARLAFPSLPERVARRSPPPS
jgi:membrane protein required for colicin V production